MVGGINGPYPVMQTIPWNRVSTLLASIVISMMVSIEIDLITLAPVPFVVMSMLMITAGPARSPEKER